MNQNELRRRAGRLASLLPLVVSAALCGWGCSASPTDGDGTKVGYNLLVIVEKNLDAGSDFLWVRLWRDGEAIAGGRVVVDGDTVTTLPLSGQGSKTYAGSHWTHGQAVRITALDSSRAFSYKDSVTLPGAFFITNVSPANRLWSGGSVVVEWSPVLGISGFAVLVKPRTSGSSAKGLSVSVGRGETSYTFNRSAFENSYGQLVADVYDIQVIGYTPNLLARPGAAYKQPPTDTPAPIDAPSISGAISSLVVTARDYIVVPQ